MEKTLEWLNDKWIGKKICFICKENNWNLHSDITEIRNYYGGSMVLGGKVIPIIVLTCLNCGNTLLFNANISK